MNQPLYRPDPTSILASTDLRQKMKQTFAELNNTKGSLVVTVANKPRVVISDFTTYHELLYKANGK